MGLEAESPDRLGASALPDPGGVSQYLSSPPPQSSFSMRDLACCQQRRRLRYGMALTLASTYPCQGTK